MHIPTDHARTLAFQGASVQWGFNPGFVLLQYTVPERERRLFFQNKSKLSRYVFSQDKISLTERGENYKRRFVYLGLTGIEKV